MVLHALTTGGGPQYGAIRTPPARFGGRAQGCRKAALAFSGRSPHQHKHLGSKLLTLSADSYTHPLGLAIRSEWHTAASSADEDSTAALEQPREAEKARDPAAGRMHDLLAGLGYAAKG